MLKIMIRIMVVQFLLPVLQLNTIKNCTFFNNQAYKSGGAIYTDSNKKLTIKDCTFESNLADDDGGAICSKSELYIENSKFISNSASSDGGAISSPFLGYGKISTFSTNIYNCVFESNSVEDESGGAISVHTIMNVGNSIFKKNSAEYFGGAIASTRNLHVNGCLFESNKVDGMIVQDSYGGAIECMGVTYIDNSTFKNNLNIDLIHLPPYSPKYNPIEQVWRTIKAKISRKFITSIEQLKYIFENEFKQVIDNKSYWENWLWKFL